MEQPIVEYITIAAYVILVGSLGFIFKSFNKDSNDYFRSGARTTWWLLGTSLWISVVSASVFTGVAGAQFESGMAPMASNFGIMVSLVLLATFLAGWFRQLRLITSVEVIRNRFGVVTEQVYAWKHVVLQPVYGGFQLFGLAIFVSAVFGLPMRGVIIGLAVTIALYTFSGGKWAVMATDFLQSLILIPVTILVSVLALRAVGGIGAFIEKAGEAGLWELTKPAGAFPDGKYTWAWVAAVFFMQIVAQLQLNWSARFFAAKDGREAKKASWLLLFLFIFTFHGMIAPFVAKIMYAEQVYEVGAVLSKPVEAAYVTVCQELLPAGLIGLIIVAMFSATSSSMDSGINSNAAVLVRNVVPPILRRMKRNQLSGEGEMKLGKLISLLMIAYITAIALYLSSIEGRGVFELMLDFAAIVNFPLTLPTFLALIFRKAPRSSALMSALSGLVLPWLAFPVLQSLDIQTTFQVRVLVIALSGTIGYFASYLFARFDDEKHREQIRDFYRTMHTPVDFEKEVGESNDDAQMLILGRLALLVGGMMLLLLLVPNEPWARISIICLGLSVGSIGGILLWAGVRARRKKRALGGVIPPGHVQ